MNSTGTSHRRPARVAGAGSEIRRPPLDKRLIGGEDDRASLVGHRDRAERILADRQLENRRQIVEPDVFLTVDESEGNRAAPILRQHGERRSRRLAGQISDRETDEGKDEGEWQEDATRWPVVQWRISSVEILHSIELVVRQVRMIGDGLARLHVHVERHRRSASHPNLNAVRSWCQIKMLERAVEVVDDASVVAVGENLRVTRRSRDAHATVGWSGRDVANWRVRVTVPVAVPAVSIRITDPDRDSTIRKAEAEPDRQPWPVGIVGVSIAIVGISIAVVG